MTARRKISVSIDAALMARVERLAKATRSSVSRWIENQIRDGIDQEELAVKVFSDPAMGRPLAKLVGDPEFLRGVTRLLKVDLSDQQLKLFTDKLAGVSIQQDEPAVVTKMKEHKRGKKK